MSKWPEDFTLSKLIICEGLADKAFFRAMIEHLGLPGPHIRSTADRKSLNGETPSGGITQFENALLGFRSITGFEKIKNILIVADNDETPTENFNSVTAQIAALSPFGNPPRQYPVPTAPLIAASGDPEITVLMIPYTGIKGNLETLCLDAARSVSSPITACVDAFAKCAGVDEWHEEGKKAKMHMRSILAAGHRGNPAIGIGKIWNEAPHLIPIAHPSFNQIAAVLKAFC